MAQVSTILVLDKDGVVREVPTLLAVTALLGDAVENPAENTLLDRVKDVAVALAGTLGVNQVSNSRDVSATITRAVDTNVYDAGDVVGPALTFTAAGKPAPGGPILINGVQLKMNVASLPAGIGAFRLHLYSVTPPSALTDGATFVLDTLDDAAWLGCIDIPKPTDIGPALYAEVNNIGKQVKLNSQNVYAYLQTVSGWAPGAGDVYKITLHTNEV